MRREERFAGGAEERFTTIVQGPEDGLRLDVAAFCISACVQSAAPDGARVDVDAEVLRLDELAHGADASFASVRSHLFDRCGFDGDRDDYGNPRNSFLDAVLDRRTGIPITLSVLLMEVARRAGVVVDGVGMPGHFLTRVPSEAVWCDPFHHGAVLDRDAVAALFARVSGDRRPLADEDLAPVPARAILGRMLTNLEHGRLGGRRHEAALLCRLHLAIPGVALAHQVQLVRRLARIGDPSGVARAYATVIARAPDALAGRLRTEADQLRGRWN